MPFEFQASKRRLMRFRAFVSFFVVAAAQFLSPAAAADPASKIDPPAWSHHHSKEELQAYGARASAQEPDKKLSPVIREAKLRRILRQQQSDKSQKSAEQVVTADSNARHAYCGAGVSPSIAAADLKTLA